MNEIVTGSVEGTGGAIDVPLGWVPDYVKLFNYDDAGGLAPTLEWWKGMADGHGLKGLGVADDGTTGNASQAKVTANGISAFAGDGDTAPGFTIGADADLNASGETIFYVAVRNGPGAQR